MVMNQDLQRYWTRGGGAHRWTGTVEPEDWPEGLTEGDVAWLSYMLAMGGIDPPAVSAWVRVVRVY